MKKLLSSAFALVFCSLGVAQADERGLIEKPPRWVDVVSQEGTVAPGERVVSWVDIQCGDRNTDGSVTLHLSPAAEPTTRRFFSGNTHLSFSSVTDETMFSYTEIHNPGSELTSESYGGILTAPVDRRFFDPENWKSSGRTLWFSVPDLGFENPKDGGRIDLAVRCPEAAKPEPPVARTRPRWLD
jgi:hypothetical protein